MVSVVGLVGDVGNRQLELERLHAFPWFGRRQAMPFAEIRTDRRRLSQDQLAVDQNRRRVRGLTWPLTLHERQQWLEAPTILFGQTGYVPVRHPRLFENQAHELTAARKDGPVVELVGFGHIEAPFVSRQWIDHSAQPLFVAGSPGDFAHQGLSHWNQIVLGGAARGERRNAGSDACHGERSAGSDTKKARFAPTGQSDVSTVPSRRW